MMTKVWLYIADTFVYLLLFTSFILFYLNPSSYTYAKKMMKKPYILQGTLPLTPLDLNITLNDLVTMGHLGSVEEYQIDKNIFLEDSLEKRLTALSAKIGDPVFIRIFKEESILEVWIYKDGEYVHLKDYIICASSGHLGPKLKEGDKQSPEGFYKVKKSYLNPHSKFHLSFNLGYPNRYDRAHYRTGSFLMVHGNCVSVGCYAMTDEKIEEIYALVKGALKQGQTYVNVHAFPFRMTEENMNLYEGNEWYDFWTNLKEGYDYFEAEKLPPAIGVKNGNYTIYEANQ